MKGDFGSMVWVNDEKGHDYVYTVDRDHLKEKKYENLRKSEKDSCRNINQIVGTERW